MLYSPLNPTQPQPDWSGAVRSTGVKTATVLMPVPHLPPGMRYLVAVDGSEKSNAALEHAIAMARRKDDVAVAHAVDPDVYSTGGTAPFSDLDDASERLLIETVEDAERRGEDILEDAADLAADHGVSVGTELLYGDPLEVVHDHAVREGYDHIVVGHRGLSERAEAVAGSVAKGIVARTSLPVTVVP